MYTEYREEISEEERERLLDSVQKRQIAAQELLRKIDREQAIILKMTVTETDINYPSHVNENHPSIMQEEQAHSHVSKNPLIHFNSAIQSSVRPTVSKESYVDLSHQQSAGMRQNAHQKMSRHLAVDASSKNSGCLRYSITSSPAQSANVAPHAHMYQLNENAAMQLSDKKLMPDASPQIVVQRTESQKEPMCFIHLSKQPNENQTTGKFNKIELTQSHRSSQNTTARHLSNRQSSMPISDLEIQRQRKIVMSQNVKIKDVSFMPAPIKSGADIDKSVEKLADISVNEELQQSDSFYQNDTSDVNKTQQEANQYENDGVSLAAMDRLAEHQIQIKNHLTQIKQALKHTESRVSNQITEQQSQSQSLSATRAQIHARNAVGKLTGKPSQQSNQTRMTFGNSSRVYQAHYKCNDLEQLNAANLRQITMNNSLISSGGAVQFKVKRSTTPLYNKNAELASASKDQSTGNKVDSDLAHSKSITRGHDPGLSDLNFQNIRVVDSTRNEMSGPQAAGVLRRSFDSAASGDLKARMGASLRRDLRQEEIGGGSKGPQSIDDARKTDTAVPVSLFGVNGRSFLSETHGSINKGRNGGPTTQVEDRDTVISQQNMSYALNLTYSVAAASGDQSQVARSSKCHQASSSLSNQLMQSKGDDGPIEYNKAAGSDILPTNFVSTGQMKNQCKFLDRLVVFERSKRQKLAAARALKAKQETADLTFKPKLIAKGPKQIQKLNARRKSAQVVTQPQSQVSKEQATQQQPPAMLRRQSQPATSANLQTVSSVQVASNGQLKESSGSTIPDEFVVWRTGSNQASARYAKRLSDATIDVVAKEENEATARLNAIKARALSGAAKAETPATDNTEGITCASKSATVKADEPRTDRGKTAEEVKEVSRSKDKLQAIFERLHGDRHRLSTKIEEQQRKIIQEERETLFKPRINADQKARRKILNGRRRQSADVYSKPLLDIKRRSHQIISLNMQDVELPSKFDYNIGDLQRGARMLNHGRYRSHSNKSDSVGRQLNQVRPSAGHTQQLKMPLLNYSDMRFRKSAKSQALVSPKERTSLRPQAITDHQLVDCRSINRGRARLQNDQTSAAEPRESLSHGRMPAVNAATSELFVSEGTYSRERETAPHGNKPVSLGATNNRRHSQESRASVKDRSGQRIASHAGDSQKQAQMMIGGSPSGRALESTLKKGRRNSVTNVFEFLRRDAIRRHKKWTYLTSEQHQREIAIHQAARVVRRSKSASSKEPVCPESELKALLGHKTRALRHSDDLYRRNVIKEIDVRLITFARQRLIRHLPGAMTEEEEEASRLEQGGYAADFTIEQFKQYLFQQKLLTGEGEYVVDRHCRTNAIAMSMNCAPKNRRHSSAATREPSQPCSQRSSTSRISGRIGAQRNDASASQQKNSLALKSYCNKDRVLFKKMIKLLTPFGSERPVLTFRNVRCLMYIIVNKFEPWMNQRDSHEFSDAANSSYRRKIWKYTMFLKNLKQPGGEALAKCYSQGNHELVDGLSKDNILQLKEHEREAFVVRDTQFSCGAKAKFHGQSLCVTEKAVNKLSVVFQELSRPLLNFLMGIIRNKKMCRDEQTWERIASEHSSQKKMGADLKRQSAFKQITQADRDRCEIQRRNFLEMSNRKKQQENSHSKSRSKSKETRQERAYFLRQRSLEKVRYIIQNNSQDSFEGNNSKHLFDKSRAIDQMQQNTLKAMFPSFAPNPNQSIVSDLYQINNVVPPPQPHSGNQPNSAVYAQRPSVSNRSNVAKTEADSATLRSYQAATISRKIKEQKPVTPADRTKPKARKTYMDSYQSQSQVIDKSQHQMPQTRFVRKKQPQKENVAPRRPVAVNPRKIISQHLAQKTQNMFIQKRLSQASVQAQAQQNQQQQQQQMTTEGSSENITKQAGESHDSSHTPSTSHVPTAQLIHKHWQLCNLES